MNRRSNVAKAISVRTKEFFFLCVLMNFYVRISSRGERECKGRWGEVIDDFFLHVLIGFLLYGALNEQSILDDV